MSKRIRIRLAVATLALALGLAGIAVAQLGSSTIPSTATTTTSRTPTPPTTAGALALEPAPSVPPTQPPANTLPSTAAPQLATIPLSPIPSTATAPPAAPPPSASVPPSPAAPAPNNAAPVSNPPLAGVSRATTTTPPPANTVTPISPSGTPVPTRLTSNVTGATPPPAPAEIRNSLRVSKGNGTLPNDGGQIWREYDITPYTSRFNEADRPEQAIIDWVLRETGTELWFTQPVGVLNADRNTLRVYHTADTQERVRSLVERFLATAVMEKTLVIRVITLNSPGWRSRALPMLKPIEVNSPGIDGWLLAREDAAVLMGELRKRADFKEQGAPVLQAVNGQDERIVRTRPRMYPRTIRLRPDMWPGYETINGQIEEGFQLQLSPLPSLDGKQMEVAIKCNIDQVERLVPVTFDVPIAGQIQKTEIQVPQLVSWRLHERLRWNADQVLLLSCGVVASPGPEPNRLLSFLNPLESSGRADALLMIEVKDGPPSAHATTLPAAAAATVPGHALPIQPLPMQQTPATATRPTSPSPWRF